MGFNSGFKGLKTVLNTMFPHKVGDYITTGITTVQDPYLYNRAFASAKSRSQILLFLLLTNWLGRHARVSEHLAVENVAHGAPLGGGSTLYRV